MSEQQISKEERLKALEAMSDILLVLDKKKNKIEAVQGVDDNGNLKSAEPKESNLMDFIRIDKADPISNFFSNFWRRLNDPGSFRFFKSSEIDLFDIVRKLQKAIDNPSPEGMKLLEALEINYDKLKKQNMDTNQTNGAEQQEQTKPTYKFKVEDIDWSSLEKLNLNRELLEKNGQLDKLLKGYKSDGVYRIDGNFDGVVWKGDARLALRTVNDKVVVMAHGVRMEPDLKNQFYGHSFTPEDRENLLKTGNMGRVAELINYSDGTKVKALISIDKLTNEVVSFPVDLIKLSSSFGGVKLSPEQKSELLEGKPVLVEGMKNSKTGEPFSQNLQYSADEKKLVFVGSMSQRQAQTSGITDEFRGKVLTDQDKKMLEEGSVIHLKDIVNRERTKLYSGYLWFNKEEGRLNFDLKNPELSRGGEQSLSDPQKQKENQQNTNAAQDAAKETKKKTNAPKQRVN